MRVSEAKGVPSEHSSSPSHINVGAMTSSHKVFLNMARAKVDCHMFVTHETKDTKSRPASLFLHRNIKARGYLGFEFSVFANINVAD